MIDRLGRRLPTTLGVVILAVGVLPIALAGQDVSIPTLLAGLALVGVGLGLASPALQTSGVEAVESDQAGSAAGLYSTSRYLGSITGSAIIAGILGASDMDVDGLSWYSCCHSLPPSLRRWSASGSGAVRRCQRCRECRPEIDLWMAKRAPSG